MRTEIHVGFFDILIFLGLFQGLFLSWFFIIKTQNNRKANLYQGLLLLFFSLIILEEWLNNTGYIVKVLAVTNFSEPLIFALAPLLYMYIRSSLNPEGKNTGWAHFLLFIFWLFYIIFQFIQPDEVKYNSYIETKHPDWPYLPFDMNISDDPLGIRRYCNQLLAIQFSLYLGVCIFLLVKKSQSLGQSIFRINHELLKVLRNTTVHFIFILAIFLATKLYFGMRSDLGSYLIAAYISFMIYATSYQVLNRSDFFSQPGSFLAFPIMKYQRSSLSGEQKEMILEKIRKEMETNRYFTNNLSSLSGLSKQINESSHYVSQVINEKLNKNFFELLASYRIDYAMKLIREDKEIKLTVEELAERVGYNSKSSFNNAFKNITSQTPSEYRKSVSGS